MSSFLPLHWPVPDNVGFAISTRTKGVSESCYAQNNLAFHVNDVEDCVIANRQSMQNHLQLAMQPQWLEQVHGVNVVKAKSDGVVRTADGCITTVKGLACTVLTADCLPVLMCDTKGQQVAAVHAGWRGLAKGVLTSALAQFNAPPNEVLVFLGPAISSEYFEVGVEVLEAFFDTAKTNEHSNAIAQAISPSSKPLHFYADLYALARASLLASGVVAIEGGAHCTYREEETFYSYRRDGETGRMASLIWLKS